MSNKTISIDQLSSEIQNVLETYNKDIAEATKKEAKSSMAKLVSQTKATAPKHRPRYVNHITSKKEWENSQGAGYVWYVSGSEYRLSHLLEFGHALKNGGRSKAFGFIQRASEPIIEEYIRAVEEVIKNG